jgi:hypothetical protein
MPLLSASEKQQLIAVKAYFLWKQMTVDKGIANDVDRGPWYYWFLAEFMLDLGPFPEMPKE